MVHSENEYFEKVAFRADLLFLHLLVHISGKGNNEHNNQILGWMYL